MKFPLSWIKEYVSINIPAKELADKLMNAGFEVEEITETSGRVSNVVCGKIISAQKHPEADRLRICSVDTGAEIVVIVTAAANVSTGDLVPVALNGAVLADGTEIKSAPLRGVMSYGMFCGAAELGIDANYYPVPEDGVVILQGGEPGQPVFEVIGGETVLNISITSNRSDCQSIYGMAREISAILARPLKPLDLKYRVADSTAAPEIGVEILAPDACPRYMAQPLSAVKIAESPLWMRRRLSLCGIRAINNLIDITNYVLLETGQPMHAFDCEKLADKKINVRCAAEGESITALDGKAYQLKPGMLVIADGSKPQAIAGVMGGAESGVSDTTACAVLESAKFQRGGVRQTSRALGLRSESSARFEKGVDSESPAVGMARALALVNKLKCAVVAPAYADVYPVKPEPQSISVKFSRLEAILGIPLKKAAAEKILKRLMFEPVIKGETLSVTVPAFRQDIEGFPDLAEEIIRIQGYSAISGRLLTGTSVTAGSLPQRVKATDGLKRLLVGLGLSEIVTYAFVPTGSPARIGENAARNITVANPLSEEYALMRTTLVHNMLSTLAFNENRKNEAAALFETGKAYLAKSLPLTELPEEKNLLSCGFLGGGADFYTVKGIAEAALDYFGISGAVYKPSVKPFLHPGMAADIFIGDNSVGFLGRIHPRVAENYGLSGDAYILEADLDALLSAASFSIFYEPLPKYPAVERDLAVAVPEEAPAGDMLKEIKAASALIKEASLFDIYRGAQVGEGFKSMAFSLKLSSHDHTLTDAEINAAMDAVLLVLATKFGAGIRA